MYICEVWHAIHVVHSLPRQACTPKISNFDFTHHVKYMFLSTWNRSVTAWLKRGHIKNKLQLSTSEPPPQGPPRPSTVDWPLHTGGCLDPQPFQFPTPCRSDWSNRMNSRATRVWADKSLSASPRSVETDKTRRTWHS